MNFCSPGVLESAKLCLRHEKKKIELKRVCGVSALILIDGRFSEFNCRISPPVGLSKVRPSIPRLSNTSASFFKPMAQVPKAQQSSTSFRPRSGGNKRSPSLPPFLSLSLFFFLSGKLDFNEV